MDEDVRLIRLFFILFIHSITLCTGESLHVLIGKDARIPCGLQNIDSSKPHDESSERSVDWTLPHTTEIDGHHISQENHGRSLFIHDVTSSDNGFYRCEVDQFSHSFNLTAGQVSESLFQGFRLGLPIAECSAEREAKYEVGVEGSFCGQSDSAETCWAQIQYVGCFNNELYEVDITPRITESTIIDASDSLTGILQEVTSEINTSYNKSKANLVQFLKHSDFPVDVSHYAFYPKWYIDFFFGGSVYEQVRQEVAERLVETLPEEINPANTRIRCDRGYSSNNSPLFCLPCSPGQYGTSSSCLPCPSGTYQDSYAQAMCKQCTAGTVSETKSQCTATVQQHQKTSTASSSPKTSKKSTARTTRRTTTEKPQTSTQKASTKTTMSTTAATVSSTAFAKANRVQQDRKLGQIMESTGPATSTTITATVVPTTVTSGHIKQQIDATKTNQYRNQLDRKPTNRGTIMYPFQLQESKTDPTKYILIGTLILVIAVFVVLCVIKIKRREDHSKPYKRILRGKDIDDDDDQGEQGQYGKGPSDIESNDPPRSGAATTADQHPSVKKDSSWSAMLKDLKLSNLYNAGSDEVEQVAPLRSSKKKKASTATRANNRNRARVLRMSTGDDMEAYSVPRRPDGTVKHF